MQLDNVPVHGPVMKVDAIEFAGQLKITKFFGIKHIAQKT